MEIKKTHINSYEELKKMSITELEQNCYQKFKIKGYDIYLLYCEPYYNNVLVATSNNRVIYIDEQIQYPIHKFNHYNLKDNNYNVLQVVKKMIEKAKQKLFTDDEILNDSIKSYDEYLNKENFLNNIVPSKFDYISMFYIGERPEEEQKQIEKMYPCRCIGFCYFNEKWQADYLTNLYIKLQEKYKEFLKNKENREQTILFELCNHEAFYTWDIDSTYWAIGDKFTRDEILNVFNKHCKKQQCF